MEAKPPIATAGTADVRGSVARDDLDADGSGRGRYGALKKMIAERGTLGAELQSSVRLNKGLLTTTPYPKAAVPISTKSRHA